MSALGIAGIIFVCVFGAALIGMLLSMTLPKHHLADDSKETVKLVMGLIATMAALVLSLLVASAKTSYDSQSSAITQLSANVVLVDRELSLYGTEASEARVHLREAVAGMIDRIWPRDRTRGADLAPPAAQGTPLGAFYMAVQNLSPRTDGQRFIQGQVLQTLASTGQTRMLMYEQASNSISWPFLGVLVFWLCVLFAGFGLFAARNATTITVLLVGALSVAGAIFLILELSTPYEGVLQISSAGLRNALAEVGK